MLIGEIDQADELKPSVKNGLFVGAIYIVKVGFSLIGGGSTSQKYWICQRSGSCLR